MLLTQSSVYLVLQLTIFFIKAYASWDNYLGRRLLEHLKAQHGIKSLMNSISNIYTRLHHHYNHFIILILQLKNLKKIKIKNTIEPVDINPNLFCLVIRSLRLPS